MMTNATTATKTMPDTKTTTDTNTMIKAATDNTHDDDTECDGDDYGSDGYGNDDGTDQRPR